MSEEIFHPIFAQFLASKICSNESAEEFLIKEIHSHKAHSHKAKRISNSKVSTPPPSSFMYFATFAGVAVVLGYAFRPTSGHQQLPAKPESPPKSESQDAVKKPLKKKQLKTEGSLNEDSFGVGIGELQMSKAENFPIRKNEKSKSSSSSVEGQQEESSDGTPNEPEKEEEKEDEEEEDIELIMQANDPEYVDLGSIKYEGTYGECTAKKFKKLNEKVLRAKMNFRVVAQDFMEKLQTGVEFKDLRDDVATLKAFLCADAPWSTFTENKSLKEKYMDFSPLPIGRGDQKEDFCVKPEMMKINEKAKKFIEEHKLSFFGHPMSNRRNVDFMGHVEQDGYNYAAPRLIGSNGDGMDPLTTVYCLHRSVPDFLIQLDFFMGRVSFLHQKAHQKLYEKMTKESSVPAATESNEEIKKFFDSYDQLSGNTKILWQATNWENGSEFESMMDEFEKPETFSKYFNLPKGFSPRVIVYGMNGDCFQKPSNNIDLAQSLILSPKNPIDSFRWTTLQTKEGAQLPSGIQRMRIFDPKSQSKVPKERTTAKHLARKVHAHEERIPVFVDEQRPTLLIEWKGGQVLCFRLAGPGEEDKAYLSKYEVF